jgi:hypothetical protein
MSEQIMYEIVKNTNDWIKDYKGQTYSEELQRKLVNGLFEEHYKFSQQKTFKQILSEFSFLTEKQKQLIINKTNGTQQNVLEKIGKKCVVYTLDPVTMEIEDIGGSSLLRDTKTGIIEPNMILDNFGTWFQNIIRGDTTMFTLIDDVNSIQNFKIQTTGNIYALNSNWAGKFGGGSTAPAKSNFKIDTPLSGSPENTYIASTGWGYNVFNQIIFNIDANPMGATETINEIVVAGLWANTSAVTKNIALTRDIVGPVSAVIGKLERAAFAFQI